MKKYEELTDKEKVKMLKLAVDDFVYFTNNIFPYSIDILKNNTWIGGKHIDNIAQYLVDNDMTMRVSARDHFKSMSFYSHIMWKILRMAVYGGSREMQYFSYGQIMASYHLAKIKKAIKSNPFFDDVIDNKQIAESILSYSWDSEGGDVITVNPRGLMEFKRGIHCDDVYIDDPFQDPENKLVPTKIEKINNIIKTQILDMFQKELHIVGTAQTKTDFFFDKDVTQRFAVKIEPAIILKEGESELSKGTALWEEWADIDELLRKRAERGEKIFNQEYMCSPVYSEEAFVKSKDYDSLVDNSLVNYNTVTWANEIKKRMDKKGEDYEDNDVYAGFDIGKKAHPSHFAVFEVVDNIAVQRVSKWFDNVNYTDQIEVLNEYAEVFDIISLLYDNTRGEFEGFDEKGELASCMEGFNFSFKSKHSIAGNLDKYISNKKVKFLDDRRQRDQLLSVNNDLQAPETKGGHGDSFWSICLGLKNCSGGGVDITIF